MFTMLRTTAFAALIAAGAAALPATAQADSLVFSFGDDGARAGIAFEDARMDERRDWRHGRRDQRRHDDWRRSGARACTPERALDKAERMGLRRARIVDVDRRTITVRGRLRGDREFVTFARAPRCPVVG